MDVLEGQTIFDISIPLLESSNSLFYWFAHCDCQDYYRKTGQWLIFTISLGDRLSSLGTDKLFFVKVAKGGIIEIRGDEWVFVYSVGGLRIKKGNLFFYVKNLRIAYE